jgi:hypothetical protein
LEELLWKYQDLLLLILKLRKRLVLNSRRILRGNQQV